MPIDFPSSPSSGQRYDYLSKSWIWNDVYWASVGASGNISSGQLGTPVLFSGNIASGSIGSFHFASGVVGGGGSLSSGSVTSGLIGDNAVVSGSIGSGQVGRFQISYFNIGQIFSNTFGNNSITSGNVGSGQIGQFHFISGIIRTATNPVTLLGGTKGFFAGGSTGSYVATADKVTYSTDTTIAQTTANLSQARYNLAAISQGTTKGYFVGGSTDVHVRTGDRIIYSTETTAVQTSAQLPSPGREGLAGCDGEGTKGYFAGGSTGATYFTTAYKTTYSTDTTATQASANLSQARGNLAGISDWTAKGYFIGGIDLGFFRATADKITYSTDTTAAQTSADLPTATYGVMSVCQGSEKSYILGGNTSPSVRVTTANILTYATDTTATQTSANLSTATRAGAGVSEGSSKGYVAGGQTGTSALVATAYKITFATDTTDLQASANLSQARDQLAGVGQYSFDYTVVNSGNFGNSSVTSGNIGSGTISRFHLSDASVYADDVLSGNVSTFKFANNAVFSGNISSSAIPTTSLASGGFRSGAFGDNAISSGDILSGRIVASHISSGEINSSHIVSGALFNYHIGSVGTYNLSDNLILSGNIGSGRISIFAFENGAILSGNIASGVIGNTHFGNASVTSSAIPSGTVIFNMVGALAAAPYNFADVALSSGNFALQSVTGENLADGVWQQPTTSYVSGGITAFMFNNNAISFGNFGVNSYSKAGYFAGGIITGSVSVTTADKLIYSTDTTAAQASANLSQARFLLTGCSSLTNGYFAGGTSSVSFTTADKLKFSTDTTAAQTTANLSQARSLLAGCSGNGIKGYFAGGNTTVTADKLTYATDTTAAQTTANLSQARSGLAGVSEGTTKGYFAGGSTGAVVTTADKLTFSTDATAAQTSANLSQARDQLAGCSGEGSKGYFAGGLNALGNRVITADKLTYSTDATAAQTTANLSQARENLAGISEGSTKGYFAGGFTIIFLSTVDKITYSTDTTAAQTTANLSQGRYGLAGVDGGNAPLNYAPLVVSGSLTTTDANKTRSTNFASGSVLSGNMTSGVVTSIPFEVLSISNNAIRSGNIASEQVSISYHLAKETITSVNIGSGVIRFPEFFGDAVTYTKIASGQIGRVHLENGLVSLSLPPINKGYFAGGLGVTTADQIIYSTDTTTAQTNANLSLARSGLAGVSEGSTKGYFAGGLTSVAQTRTDKLTYSNNTTVAQTTANLSQARSGLAGCSGEGTKGYFVGGASSTNNNSQVTTADKLTYSTDTTAAQASANLSQARYNLAGISEGTTKGYFAGGATNNAAVATADKLTYSTDTTVAQTTANLSTATNAVAGCSGNSTNGYFAGGRTTSTIEVATAYKLTYSTDTTAAQTSANLSQARQFLAGVSEKITKGYFAGGDSGSVVATTDKLTYSTDTTVAQTTADLSQARQGLAGNDGGGSYVNSQILSGTIGLTTASGQNAAFPYNLAETAEINTSQPLFDYFRAGELISGGIRAVCIASGSLLRRAECGSGLRLPAIGVVYSGILSGQTGTVYTFGNVRVPGLTLAQSSGLNNGISGFQGRPLYVGSGGRIVNQSGFWVGGVQQPPFLSGNMQQQIGIAISGGIFVMPSPRINRSGFQGNLPYNI